MSSSSRYSALRETLDEVLEISDFSIPTWLALGAGLQLLCASWLSARLSFLVPVLWLAYRALVTAIGTWRVSKGAAYSKKVMRGRWTSDLPQLNRDGVVLLILCARLNHPIGKVAPGNLEIDEQFKDMWRDAEENSKKYTYIGRSATLYDVSDSETTTFTWLSWWKDIRGLQAFAAAATHRLGQTNYDKGKFPHIGIMHETYHAPNGHWETIYDDFAPWGMGQFGLKPSQRGSTMFKRMGKKDW